jgi:hypothetical protein
MERGDSGYSTEQEIELLNSYTSLNISKVIKCRRVRLLGHQHARWKSVMYIQFYGNKTPYVQNNLEDLHISIVT